MVIKHWQQSDFSTPEQAVAHRLRSGEHWRDLARVWFWLCGPGSDPEVTRTGEYREGSRRWNAPEERRVAERLRTRHGWTLSTVSAAHAFAATRSEPKKVLPVIQHAKRKPARSSAALGDDATPAEWIPPATIERDWPERWDIPHEERHRMFRDALGPAWTPMRRTLFLVEDASTAVDEPRQAEELDTTSGTPYDSDQGQEPEYDPSTVVDEVDETEEAPC